MPQREREREEVGKNAQPQSTAKARLILSKNDIVAGFLLLDTPAALIRSDLET